MKCPSCKKILKNVRVYSQYYQDASLKGNKIVEYMGELVFLEILEIGCPKCGELLTSYIKE